MSLFRRMNAVVLAGVFVISSAGALMAKDRDDRCDVRVRKAERQLENAERKHGEHSRQADKKRHELEEAREKCGRDHDHDRDHDNH